MSSEGFYVTRYTNSKKRVLPVLMLVVSKGCNLISCSSLSGLSAPVCADRTVSCGWYPMAHSSTAHGHTVWREHEPCPQPETPFSLNNARWVLQDHTETTATSCYSRHEACTVPPAVCVIFSAQDPQPTHTSQGRWWCRKESRQILPGDNTV